MQLLNFNSPAVQHCSIVGWVDWFVGSYRPTCWVLHSLKYWYNICWFYVSIAVVVSGLHQDTKIHIVFPCFSIGGYSVCNGQQNSKLVTSDLAISSTCDTPYSSAQYSQCRRLELRGSWKLEAQKKTAINYCRMTVYHVCCILYCFFFTLFFTCISCHVSETKRECVWICISEPVWYAGSTEITQDKAVLSCVNLCGQFGILLSLVAFD